MTVDHLPRYPNTRAREALSPSQHATLNSVISTSLAQILALPPDKRDRTNALAFISSYARDHAQVILQDLIWHGAGSEQRSKSKVERTISQRVLLLAEKFAAQLDLQTLIDISVVYGKTSPRRTRDLLSAAHNATGTELEDHVRSEAVPAFTALLVSPVGTQGLYGLRKTTHVLLSFLRAAPRPLIRPFARDKYLVLALAQAYNEGLAALAQGYGGIRPSRLSSVNQAEDLDEWERVFLEAKTALVDAFHILLTTLLGDISEDAPTGPTLEAAFEVVFALVDLQSASTSTEELIPFVNQTLLTDYQRTYDLAGALARATKRTDDARTELLESALRPLDAPDGQAKDTVLKLLVRSSGIPLGIDNLGKGPSQVIAVDKGKGKAPATFTVVESDPKLDEAVTQVLDILPEQSPDYVRFVLSHPDYPYRGDAERLIGALLEGTAPDVEAVEGAMAQEAAASESIAPQIQQQTASTEQYSFTKERQNVFDNEQMDLSRMRVGKKTDDAATVLQDRAFIEQMKADILRRAEEVSDSEEEEDTFLGGAAKKHKGQDVAFEEELDVEGAVRVRDGEPSEDEGTETDDDGTRGETQAATPQDTETLLELAYIRDPRLFDRDAQTRRSKARADLKMQTNWTDEQIEGWRIMLERNPRKDKILQKHEFAGNKAGPISEPAASSSQQQQDARGGRGGRGGGRGGGGGSGGRGRGGGRGDHGGEDGGTARERAWKDKNKARRGNHNRKRGHDKKMARAAGPPS